MDKFTYISAAIVLALSVTPTFAQQDNPYSPSNNPYSPQDNPYRHQNNPYNPDANQYGGRNATYDNEGTYNGYTDPKEDGIGVRAVSPDENPTGYTDGE